MTPEEKKIRELSDKAFAEHRITPRYHSPCFTFGSWRCQREGSWTHGFDITVAGGSLFVTGDIGDLIVSRCANMIAWCRGSCHSTDYFAAKVPRAIETREFSDEKFVSWCHEHLADEDIDPEHKEIIEYTMRYFDESSEGKLIDDLVDIWQGSDPPDWRVWNANFLWCRDAVRWFVANLNDSQAVPVQPFVISTNPAHATISPLPEVPGHA